MTQDELTAVGMLKGVKFASPSWDERTSTHLFRVANQPLDAPADWQPMITKKQSHQLWRVLFRHRRQIEHPERVKYLRMAEKLMVPEYRSYEYRKAQEASYKIAKMKRDVVEKEAV